eukprot:SAG31_NODE_2984_length_4824_cov_183.057143_3_plen_204_part_00
MRARYSVLQAEIVRFLDGQLLALGLPEGPAGEAVSQTGNPNEVEEAIAGVRLERKTRSLEEKLSFFQQQLADFAQVTAGHPDVPVPPAAATSESCPPDSRPVATKSLAQTATPEVAMTGIEQPQMGAKTTTSTVDDPRTTVEPAAPAQSEGMPSKDAHTVPSSVAQPTSTQQQSPAATRTTAPSALKRKSPQHVKGCCAARAK